MSTPGVAVLNRVDEHRRRASEMEPYAPQQAELLRTLADEYEREVLDSIEEWWTTAAVQQAKGWSMEWIRRKARELVGVGKARKTEGGHWEIRWDAVLALPNPPERLEELEVDDIDALAEELAAEG